MTFVRDDGGRANAGYSGVTGDCVTRAIAIAATLPYQQVYDDITSLSRRHERKGPNRKGFSSARSGVYTNSAWFKRYMHSIGFVWTPTMGIGTGCKVHLHDDELPTGRLVVVVSKHLTAVIDGVIHDNHDPQREEHHIDFNGATDSDDPRVVRSVRRRCVYGYWRFS